MILDYILRTLESGKFEKLGSNNETREYIKGVKHAHDTCVGLMVEGILRIDIELNDMLGCWLLRKLKVWHEN